MRMLFHIHSRKALLILAVLGLWPNSDFAVASDIDFREALFVETESGREYLRRRSNVDIDLVQISEVGPYYFQGAQVLFDDLARTTKHKFQIKEMSDSKISGNVFVIIAKNDDLSEFGALRPLLTVFMPGLELRDVQEHLGQQHGCLMKLSRTREWIDSSLLILNASLGNTASEKCFRRFMSYSFGLIQRNGNMNASEATLDSSWELTLCEKAILSGIYGGSPRAKEIRDELQQIRNNKDANVALLGDFCS